MAALMSYCVVVALLMSLLALALEPIVISYVARRAVWVLALALSFIVPAARLSLPHFAHPDLPSMVTHASSKSEVGPSGTIVDTATKKAAVKSIPISTEIPKAPKRNLPYRLSWPNMAAWDRLLEWLWGSTSALVLGFYGTGLIRLSRVRRQWPTGIVDGHLVRITQSTGPAVVGLFAPEIVLPRWLIDGPTEDKAMALSHERQHILAHDPILLHAAVFLVILAPWNFPLWWQLRRLRFAIEADCDQRVLREGTDSNCYGEMLLSVERNGRSTLDGALALTEKRSQLERRIRIIVGAAHSYSRVSLGLLAGLSMSVLVVAQQMDAPTISLTGALYRRWPEGPSKLRDRAREVSRSQFPDLFEQIIDGAAVIEVVFNSDGTLRSATKQVMPRELLPEAVDTWIKSPPPGAEPEDIASSIVEDAPLGAWSDSKNPYQVVLVAKVLSWPIDMTRSAELVKKAISAYFPYPAAPQPERLAIVSVLMNEDGSVGHAERKIVQHNVATADEFDLPAVNGDEVGRFGRTALRGFSTNSFVHYAWPRRSGEPPALTEEEARFGWWRTPQQDAEWKKWDASLNAKTPEDDAVVAKYFSKVVAHGMPAHETLWALLGRDGKIQATGQSVTGDSSFFLQKELEARFPGTQIAPECYPNSRPIHMLTAAGQDVTLTYECLSIRSKVRNIREAQPTTDDIFISGYLRAHVDVDNPPGQDLNMPITVAAQFGQPSISTFQAIQILATKVGNDSIELKLRRLDVNPDTPSAWSPAYRVKYGAEQTAELPTRLNTEELRFRVLQLR